MLNFHSATEYCRISVWKTVRCFGDNGSSSLFLLVIISLIKGEALFETEEIPLLVVWVIHAVVMSGGAIFLYKNIYWKKPEKDVKKYLEEYVAKK